MFVVSEFKSTCSCSNQQPQQGILSNIYCYLLSCNRENCSCVNIVMAYYFWLDVFGTSGS